mgnify:CR=1 FL=1
MNVLIVKLSSIGDVVHAIPAVAAIKRHRPDARISWMVEKGSAELLRNAPIVDDLKIVDTKSIRGISNFPKAIAFLRRLRAELLGGQFDIAIDMQGLMKSAVMAKISGATKIFGFETSQLRESFASFVIDHQIEIPAKTNIIHKNMILAGAACDFDPTVSPVEFPIELDENEKLRVSEIVEGFGKEFVLLNPAGGWPTKLWSPERFGTLADLIHERLGLLPVIVTGPGEDGLAEIVRQSSQTGALRHLKTDLRTFFGVSAYSELYVGGDTGPTHIAAAARAPIVGIFGPTEWWRNGSLNDKDISVERKDIGCRTDCHRRSCSNWICMEISVEDVFSAVERRIGR